jgi:hypothetical protein
MNAHNLVTPETPTYCEEDKVEMGRLINAALVDRDFCNLLLSDPSAALEKGFNGKMFRLSARDRQFMLTVKATSLTNFAEKWVSREGQ